MPTELKYSEDVNPDFFEAASDSALVYATATINLGRDHKTLIHNAKALAVGLSPMDEAKLVAAELMKDPTAIPMIVTPQKTIINALGSVLHVRPPEVSFVIKKADMMREVYGHPSFRIITVESIGAPNVRLRAGNQPAPTAGVA